MSWLSDILDNLFGHHVKPAPPVPPAPPPPPPPVPATADAVITLINQARAAQGLARLATDSKLSLTAYLWASSMAIKGVLDHGSFEARISAIYPGDPGAEDIAEGFPDAKSVVSGWLGSPPHRRNIMGPYDRVGVGSESDASGNVYWTADFLSSKSESK